VDLSAIKADERRGGLYFAAAKGRAYVLVKVWVAPQIRDDKFVYPEQDFGPLFDRLIEATVAALKHIGE
jgi:hypothetical protein